jgi:transposase
MIREQEASKDLFVSWEEIVQAPPRSFYKRLSALGIDWSELARPLRAAFSETTGRPTDPAVYLKIFAVGYWENCEFDTDLADRISDSLAIREFLGYGLTERLPDHSSLSRVRHRVSQICDLGAVLAGTVRLCSEAGLVGGDSVAIDTTLIPARVSRESLIHLDTGLKIGEHVARCLEANGEKPKVECKDLGSSDSGARLSRKPNVPLDFHYKMTHSVDFKGKVIVCSEARFADEGESACAGYALRASHRALGGRLCRVVCDKGMDDSRFHALAEELGVQAHTNLEKPGGLRASAFGKEMFVYDSELDAYRCPNGLLLNRAGVTAEGRVHYRSRSKECSACVLKEYCLKKDSKMKMISRGRFESSRERVKALAATRLGRCFLRRRKGVVEATLGHAKEHGGLRRISTKGLDAADAKAKFGAVAWNLRKLVLGMGSRVGGGTPRMAACMRALAGYLRLSRVPHSPGIALFAA